jgi:hypothetical protein
MQNDVMLPLFFILLDNTCIIFSMLLSLLAANPGSGKKRPVKSARKNGGQVAVTEDSSNKGFLSLTSSFDALYDKK